MPVAPARPESIAALTLYPRLETTGAIARRFIAAEPLLEEGLSLALAFVDAAGVKAALRHATLIRLITKIRVGYRAAPWHAQAGRPLWRRNQAR